MSNSPLTRSEARAAGLSLYTGGRVCAFGHIERYVLSAKCVACVSAENAARLATRGDELRASKSRRRAANPDHARAAYLKWKEANPEAAKQATATWRGNNKEHVAKVLADWRAANRERVAKVHVAWHENNPGARCRNVAVRRATQKEATPAWADLDAIKRIYAECARISKETGILHHVDHIIPLRGRSATGLHVHHNLQILEAQENRRKSNRVVECAA